MTLGNSLLQIIQRAVALFLFVFCSLFFEVDSLADQLTAQEIISKMEQNFLKIENYQRVLSYIHDQIMMGQYRIELLVPCFWLKEVIF